MKPYILGNEARGTEKPQGLEDMLPSWVGYLTLYGISVVPLVILVTFMVGLLAWSLK